tara:strand:+ start:6933 stop:7343 length:411 start_codon:yes stop_codon:yes gene_type:complete
MNEERLLEQLVIHEGLKLQPYRCTSDKLTIGVGRNLDDVGISTEEAEYLLKNDVKRCVDQCERTFDWFEDESDNVREAVVNLVFNMGMTRFLQFKKTIAHIENGDYELAGMELLDSRYAEQVGQRAIDVANQLSNK